MVQSLEVSQNANDRIHNKTTFQYFSNTSFSFVAQFFLYQKQCFQVNGDKKPMPIQQSIYKGGSESWVFNQRVALESSSEILHLTEVFSSPSNLTLGAVHKDVLNFLRLLTPLSLRDQFYYINLSSKIIFCYIPFPLDL